MSRLLLMSTREKGHVNPMVGVAQWLLHLGHTVGWLCLPKAPSELAAMGIETLSLEDEEEQEGEFVTGGPALAELVRRPEELSKWIRRLLVDAVAASVEPTRKVLRSWSADALVTDPMLYQGIIAAHAEKIPYACMSSSLNPITPEDFDCPHTRNMKALAEARLALFQRYGMNPSFRVADCLSPHLTTVFSTLEYVGTDIEIPPHTHLVGPSAPLGERGDETPFDWTVLEGVTPCTVPDSRPLVLVSFGSQISYQPQIFEKVAHATRTLGTKVIISCGDLAGSPWARSLPDHVLAVPYFPQRQLLPHASLFVSHGGANSVSECISAGVPILMSPVCNDQPIQAFFLMRRGAGTVLDLHEAPLENITAAIAHLLEPDCEERAAMQKVSKSYQESPGARNAAELLLSMIS